MRPKSSKNQAPSSKKRSRTPISDWIDHRADVNATGFLWSIVTGLTAILAKGVYDLYFSGSISWDVLIALPVAAWFLSIAILTHFDVNYARKHLYSFGILSLFFILSVLLLRIAIIN